MEPSTGATWLRHGPLTSALSVAVVLLLVASTLTLVSRMAPPVAAEVTPLGAGPRAGFSPGAGVFNESDADLARDLDLMKNTGAKWVRFDFPWASVEPSAPISVDGVLNHTFDWRRVDRLVDAAHARGLQVIALPFHTPEWARPPGTDEKRPPTDAATFAAFLTAGVQRYAPKGVKVWEIWNEPNLSAFWTPQPDPTAYTVLLKAAYTAIHGADPTATVMTGGLSPAVDAADGSQISPVTFLKGIYAALGKGNFDAVGMHPYSYPARPLDPSTSSWNTFYRLPLVYDVMVENGDGDKKIWSTEYGAPTGSSSQAVSESEQAAMVQDAYAGITQWPWAGPMLWYSHRDSGTDPTDREQNFGLVKNDFTAKEALSAFTTTMSDPAPPPPPAVGPGTYEDTNSAIVYTGTWDPLTNAYDSGGSVKYTNSASGSAELRFSASSVQWMARRHPNAGISDVFIDGAKVATVDLYDPSYRQKQVVFDRTGLAAGTHTIKVVRTGTKNASSSNTYQFLDAFITRT